VTAFELQEKLYGSLNCRVFIAANAAKKWNFRDPNLRHFDTIPQCAKKMDRRTSSRR